MEHPRSPIGVICAVPIVDRVALSTCAPNNRMQATRFAVLRERLMRNVGQPIFRKSHNSFIGADVSPRGFVDDNGDAYDY